MEVKIILRFGIFLFTSRFKCCRSNSSTQQPLRR
uniref:Uncharacterized protein n=1 Tax=Rhizobium phage IG49 TaxID=3129228 RepID=A0AAU8HZ20_9CAUD